jgi:peroxiredoxin
MSRKARLIACVAALILAAGFGTARVLLLREAQSGLLALQETAPDFALTDLDFHERTLADFRGRPLYITFWATWCAPCQQELADLKALLGNCGIPDLAVVCIGVREDVMGAREMRDKLELPFIVLSDRSGEAADRYGVRSIPVAYLLDASGRVRWRCSGYEPNKLKALIEGPSVLRDLLAGTSQKVPEPSSEQ